METKLWIYDVYWLVKLNATKQAMRWIFAEVEGHFKRKEFIELDNILATVDLNQLDPLTMIALLRISARANAILPNWQPLCIKVRAELTRLNYSNIDGLMVGL